MPKKNEGIIGGGHLYKGKHVLTKQNQSLPMNMTATSSFYGIKLLGN